jgi:hypothetical protein
VDGTAKPDDGELPDRPARRRPLSLRVPHARRQRRRLQRRVQGDRPPETDRPDLRVEPIPEAAALETLELEESGGTTIIKTTTVHKSVENRDGHVNSGMEAG